MPLVLHMYSVCNSLQHKHLQLATQGSKWCLPIVSGYNNQATQIFVLNRNASEFLLTNSSSTGYVRS